MPHDLNLLRRQLKQRRARLTPWQRLVSAKQIALAVHTAPLLRQAKAIALYLPFKGEADPRLLKQYLKSWQQVYLPTLSTRQAGHLVFVKWDAFTRFRLNRFGIAEPLVNTHQTIRPHDLDVVMMPLVGFDQAGHRLGMGGGFYDRTFAFKRRRYLKPHLMGYAYRFQQLPPLAAAPWDIPLDSIATEQGIQHFSAIKY